MLLNNQDNSNITRIWDGDRWYFSIIDVIRELTEYKNASRAWARIKKRLKREGAQEILARLKIFNDENEGIPIHEVEYADTETMLRIIQSLSSSKAQIFKQWLANAAIERLEEINDPEASFEKWQQRAMAFYVTQGHTENEARRFVSGIISHNQPNYEWISSDPDIAGQAAKAAREAVEQITGQLVVSSINAMPSANTLWDQLPPGDDAD